MEMQHFKAVAFAGLCMSLPIKDWCFPVVFNGSGAASRPLYFARVVARVIEIFRSENASTMLCTALGGVAVVLVCRQVREWRVPPGLDPRLRIRSAARRRAKSAHSSGGSAAISSSSSDMRGVTARKNWVISIP